ncbi:YcaO-like family protein [Yimella sp. cx-573]|nr:YcaO-like family protein [Yimella sp. cx-573]
MSTPTEHTTTTAFTPSTVPAGLRRIGRLTSPYGLVSSVSRLPVADGEPDFPIYTSSLGDPGQVLAQHAGWEHNPEAGNFDGAGGDLDPQRAAHVAVAESLERYSSCAFGNDDVIWARANDLGPDAISSDQWPLCSAAELADSRSGLVPTDPNGMMRWVQGWSFTRGRPVYVPAMQVWLKNTVQSAAERYTHPVSTGCAAHSDPAAAVLNGLLEVVERDSIALTWLQQLRLPRLEFALDELDDLTRRFVERGDSEHLRTHLFNATTDLGIPVIYGVQTSESDPVLAQLVAATCELDPGRAIAKLYRESASLRIALRSVSLTTDLSSDEADIVSVVGGALRSGQRDQRHRFGFLLDGDRPTHRLTDLPTPPSDAPDVALNWCIERLAARGCEVVAVDITTDEARQVGAHVVRVLVPQAMPLSFVHRARYLATPRLRTAPAAMGHPVHDEAHINPNPQPFA